MQGYHSSPPNDPCFRAGSGPSGTNQSGSEAGLTRALQLCRAVSKPLFVRDARVGGL